jgi:hypothetical protein
MGPLKSPMTHHFGSIPPALQKCALIFDWVVELKKSSLTNFGNFAEENYVPENFSEKSQLFKQLILIFSCCKRCSAAYSEERQRLAVSELMIKKMIKELYLL